jgi:hypothetical protein
MDLSDTYYTDLTDLCDAYYIKYLESKNKDTKKVKCIKHKILSIPYIVINDIPKFLIVKDYKFNEWTFISGCIEKKESNFQAASRELFEESKQIINLKITEKNCIYFETIFFEKNVKYVYHVHLIDLSKFGINNPRKIINSFHSKKLLNKKFNENTDIGFKSYDEICKIPNVWSFVRSNILNKFFFEKIINEL